MRLREITICFNAILVLWFVVALTAGPVAVDTAFFGDTFFLAQLGWRALNGSQPVIDYPHFYGGMTTHFITLAFKVFGPTLKSLDYAFAIIFAAIACLLALFCRKRIARHLFWLILSVAAALILSLYSIEDGFKVIVSHSFVYNHAGSALMMAVAIFACIPLESNTWLERVSAFVAGLSLFALVLLKTPFGLFSMAVLVACLIQKRWQSSILLCWGFVVGISALDPGLVRASGSLEIAFGTGLFEEVGGIQGRLFHALRTLAWHVAPLAICMVGVVFLWRKEARRMLPKFGAVLVSVGGFGAATLSMGGEPQLMLLPILVVACAIFANHIEQQHYGGGFIALVAPYLLAYPIIFAGISAATFAFVKSFEFSGSVLVENGPLSSYVIVGNESIDPRFASLTSSERRAIAVDTLANRLSEGGSPPGSFGGYVIMADGIALLQAIPDVQSYGIISTTKYEFSFAAQSKPVLEFPVWATEKNTEALDISNVDLVMSLSGYKEQGILNELALFAINENFVECRRSVFFTLLARPSLYEIICVE